MNQQRKKKILKNVVDIISTFVIIYILSIIIDWIIRFFDGEGTDISVLTCIILTIWVQLVRWWYGRRRKK